MQHEHRVMDLTKAGMATKVAGERRAKGHSQLVGAVARLVHAMSLFKQLEELLNGNAGVRGAS